MDKYKTLLISLAVLISVLAIFWSLTQKQEDSRSASAQGGDNPPVNLTNVDERFSQDDLVGGYTLPVNWGDIGVQLIENGVLDIDKFENLYANSGLLDNQMKNLLYKSGNENIVMNNKNAPVLLNIFWALGLSNKNTILEECPMNSLEYGGNPGRFASTGGWTIAVGSPMDHYSQHQFVTLNSEQQKLVEKVSKGIYRPCCNNSTHFPDCNHGMAMLGLLELMASNGASEDQMYEVALVVNSYWFPGVYENIFSYLEKTGADSISPRIALSQKYSSSSGYQKVLRGVKNSLSRQSSGCSV